MNKVSLVPVTAVFIFLVLSGCRKDLNFSYKVSMENLSDQLFHVELDCYGLSQDTVILSMPAWMPGYYQLMNYAANVENIIATDHRDNNLSIIRKDSDSWMILSHGKPFSLNYDVKSERSFVAYNYLDSNHGYIIPASTFMFVEDYLDVPVRITIIPNKGWDDIATGLRPCGKKNDFIAADFDILYDSPILIGNLTELPSFAVAGVNHRFLCYNGGDFDQQTLMNNLKKALEKAIEIIGEVPYDEYTFIGIGPGYGGIEHLNNTTVSFNGNQIRSPDDLKSILKFLVHEYFHNYNVKRIRPFELGPFDYTKENRTNLLWVSEGITVYYEYIILHRSGILTDEELYSCLAENITAYENDPGRQFQSLAQASYNTWSDGPFGARGENDKSISCYDKGAIMGLILDLAIRHSTQNTKNLDDVLRLLYYKYYRQLNRGFTDAEFRETCETVAGCSLSDEFDYVAVTGEIDYEKYLSYAGLKIETQILTNGRQKFFIKEIPAQEKLGKW